MRCYRVSADVRCVTTILKEITLNDEIIEYDPVEDVSWLVFDEKTFDDYNEALRCFEVWCELYPKLDISLKYEDTNRGVDCLKYREI